MGSIALVFDTESGHTNRVGCLIARAFPENVVDLYSAAQLGSDLVARYSAFIVGTPSMGAGKLADNWQFFVESDGFDFSGKKVAVYGLGDQLGYPTEFVDGMGVLHDRLRELGAITVGAWPTDGYTFSKSRAVSDGKFCGLAIDQDNQAELTAQRIESWVKIIEPLL